MNILDVLSAPWAIRPHKYDEIKAIYERHVMGKDADIEAIESALGKPLENKGHGYDVVDGVAIIPLNGVMAPKANMMTYISGGSSMQMVARDVLASEQDPLVHSRILLVDSPGGTVDGTVDLANVVRESSNRKPMVTLVENVMASAAVWVGTATNKVYISSSTSQVGSIGVVATHIDRSKQLEDEGVKVTEIYAGKYKRLVSEFKPLSKEGLSSQQDSVDYIYSLFVDDVATNLNVSVDDVLSGMADGKLFIGQQAIGAGLASEVVSLSDLMGKLSKNEGNNVMAIDDNLNVEKEVLTLEVLKSEHGDIYAECLAVGASAERVRIGGVLGQSLPGHEALVQALAFDGATTPEQAAVKVLGAERKVVSSVKADILADAKEVPVVAQSTVKQAPKTDKEVWDADSDLRDEFSCDYESFVAYQTATNAGYVRNFSIKEDSK